MLRNRLLILAGGCLLAASAARADGVGYIDCSAHPEETQVFAKPRQTHETVASIPCGERFTIVLYGFIFSRIQTKDGQVGYVYSNLIAMDRSGAPVQSSARPAAGSNAPAAPPTAAPTSSATPAQSQVAATQPAQTQAPVTTSNPPATAAPVAAQPNTAAVAQAAKTSETTSNSETTSAPPATAQTSAAAPKLPDAAAVAAQVYSRAPAEAATVAASSTSTVDATPAAKASETSASSTQTVPTAPAQAQAAPVQVAEAEPVKPDASASEGPATAAQPEAASAEPPARPVRPVEEKESWEKPNKGYRTVGFRRIPLIELFGGYGFARFDGGGGTSTNLNGVLGSFGWNIKPWLQLVADSSYNVVTINGTKNTLYGNHWGPRIFSRSRNKWGVTPFVEGLVGGSRLDVTISGAGGYTTSQNVISYKIGGGVDMKSFRHWEVRLVDFDYYRTSFGTGLTQNNYSISTGIVLRLFGGSE